MIRMKIRIGEQSKEMNRQYPEIMEEIKRWCDINHIKFVVTEF